MSNKLFSTLALVACGVVCAPVRAESDINVVRIFTEPAGLVFRVDGQPVNGSADFAWPANSKHEVFASDLDNSWAVGRRYEFKGWATNLTPSVFSTNQPITADPAVLWVKLKFDPYYKLLVNLIACPDPAQVCPSAGRVQVNRVIYDRYTELWFPADSTVNAAAFPNPGYIFTGWAQIPGGARPTVFDIAFKFVEPGQVAPMFQNANSAQVSVNILTDPPNLRVLVDRTLYSPPKVLEWGWGTVHTIGVDTVQMENGIAYVFESWSDGGAVRPDVKVPAQSGPLTFTASFVPAVFATFATSPPGLKLSIDGGPNFPEAGQAWAPGTLHRISAPLTQTDAQGRKYRFDSWSNGKAASFDLIVGQKDERLTAVYQLLGQAKLASVPAGLQLEIDGADCSTPCAIEKDAGSAISVSAPPLREVFDGARLVFRGWGDSTQGNRIITLSGEPTTYTAAYTRQNRLSLRAIPAEGASVTVSPPSPDGFYDEGSFVSIAVSLGMGFRMTGWTGDLSGKSTAAALRLDLPRAAVLTLDPIPAISPSGVRSAAPEAPAGSVAPGSLISIHGVHLASDLLAGPANPLAQTLGGVTVRVEDQFLPLLLVSPQQINAQLVTYLEPGTHTLTIRFEGRPETSMDFQVARNSPGLFSAVVNDVSSGLFVHANGEAVALDNPANPGETITILGTGFGPYRRTPPDGFLVGESDGYLLADVVDVIVENVRLAPVYAGRASAGVGVDALRFTLPESLTVARLARVKVIVNGTESNTVSLPLSAGFILEPGSADPPPAAQPEK